MVFFTSQIPLFHYLSIIVTLSLSSFNRDKRQWEHCLKNAESPQEFRNLLIQLEEVIHATQTEEDEIDSKDLKNKKRSHVI